MQPSEASSGAIAITGIGLVSAIGLDRESVWSSVQRGARGIKVQDPTIGGEDLHLGRVDGVGPAPEVARVTAFLVRAAAEAVGHAALDLEYEGVVGVYIGTCGSGSRGTGALDEPSQTLWGTTQGLAEAVGDLCAATGPRLVVNTACASGSHAVAVAVEHLVHGDVDVAVVGGADQVSAHVVNGFRAIKALDRCGTDPYGRSGGLSLGEGAGVLVLERADEATRRGAKVIARVAGVGTSSDAYHATAPDPSGAGAELAVRRALDHAGVRVEDVRYVNGHGSGTKANDDMERELLLRLWPDRAARPPMSATKSMTGHALGASAAIECAITAMAIERGALPPTATQGEGRHDDVDVVARVGRAASIDLAITTSYAFGGCNAAVVLGRAGGSPGPAPSPRRGVAVTGIGVVSGLGAGAGRWWHRLDAGDAGFSRRGYPAADGAWLDALAGDGIDVENADYAPAHVWRRTDRLTRNLLAAAHLALADAGEPLDAVDRDGVGCLVSSWGGPLDVTESFRSAGPGGPRLNPAVVANAAMSSPAGALSRRFGLRGPTMTFVSGGLGGWAALDHAASLIASGRTDLALVAGGEVLCAHVLASFVQAGGSAAATHVRPFDADAEGAAVAECAVVLVLEATDLTRRRSLAPYCEIAGGAAATTPRSSLDRALAGPGWSPSSVDLVVAAASGDPESDRKEAAALAERFGSGPAVTAPKSIIGETIGASALVNVAVGATALRTGVVPPVAGLRTPTIPDLGYVTGQASHRQPSRCVSVASDLRGNVGVLCLERLA